MIGTIRLAMAPDGISSEKEIAPNPDVSTPLPALVPSPTIRTALVHILSVCSASFAFISTILPRLNALPAGGTNLISDPILRNFKLLVE